MATIIKRESQLCASGTEMRKVAYDLNDLASQGDNYLQEVRTEAAAIIQQANKTQKRFANRRSAPGRRLLRLPSNAFSTKRLPNK